MSATDNILGSIARNGVTWLSRKRLPQIEGEIKLTGRHITGGSAARPLGNPPYLRR